MQNSTSFLGALQQGATTTSARSRNFRQACLPPRKTIFGCAGSVSAAGASAGPVETDAPSGRVAGAAGAGVDVGATTPEAFRDYIASEIPKWAKIVQASGAKAE